MRALIFNLSILAALLLMFAGAWMVYGLGPALIAGGWLVWATTLIVARLAIAPSKDPA